MDDIKYEYITDIKQKKSAARGAKHRNVKHRRVTLPNDNLSKKEWKKMNGSVEEINLNTRYYWDDLKHFDIRIIADYFDYLVRRFGCNNDDICEALGVSGPTFYRIKNKIKSDLGRDILRGDRSGVGGKEHSIQKEWSDFLGLHLLYSNDSSCEKVTAEDLYLEPVSSENDEGTDRVERKVFSPTPSEIIIRYTHITSMDDDIIGEAKKRLAAEMYELLSKLDDEEEIFVTISLSKSVIRHDIHY